MKYIYTRQLQRIVVDDIDEDLRMYTWSKNNAGYYGAKIKDKYCFIHKIIAKRLGIIGEVDHEDKDKSNNTRSNIRPCTHTQNAQNRNIQINNELGYKGVYTKENKYRSIIVLNGKQIYLGTFDDIILAAKAYDNAAKLYFGKFASVNFPLLSSANNGNKEK